MQIIAVQMDAIEYLNLPHDNSCYLLRTAQTRGAKIFYFTPDQLFHRDNQVMAMGQWLAFDGEKKYTVSDLQPLNLAECDAVMIRQNPPFDMAYITATYLLELLPRKTLLLNNASSIRDYPEKILPLRFPQLIPPTLISMDYDVIGAFYKTHRDIVLKPIYGRHGQRVFRIKPGDENFESIARTMLQYNEPVIAQIFLPQIYEGSKRVVMIDGQVIASMKNIPPQGSILSGYADRSPYQITDLTPAQQKICDAIGPFLAEKGLFLAGVDLIGDYLIEINITSPSGLIPIQQLYNKDVGNIFWDLAQKKQQKIKSQAA